MKKYRDKWRLFLVEGKRLCREALNSGWKIEKAFLREDFSLDSDSGLFGKILSERKIPLRMLKPDDFRKLADTENPQGIMLIVHKPAPREMREWLAAKPRILLVLDGIRDPGNMGTIIRSADWFGVSLLISSSDSVDFFNPKTVRASMGSIFHTGCLDTPSLQNTIRLLEKMGFLIVASSPQATASVDDIPTEKPLALILGGEAEGINPELKNLANISVGIARFGKAESLNVSVAAGVLLSQLVPRISL